MVFVILDGEKSAARCLFIMLWLCLCFFIMVCRRVQCWARCCFRSSDLVGLIHSFGLLAHVYADDLQVYGHMNDGSEHVMLQRFSECADSVSRWMSSNRLKLNPSKTKLIWSYRGHRQLSLAENDISCAFWQSHCSSSHC